MYTHHDEEAGVPLKLRIAIVGSRHYPNADLVREYVARLPETAVVVSGGAPGVDSFAEEAARTQGLETRVLHADWENFGRRAGPMRNEQIIASADRVVAFWDGKSRGTLNSLVLAMEKGLPTEIYGPDGESIEPSHALEVARERGVHASIAASRSPKPPPRA